METGAIEPDGLVEQVSVEVYSENQPVGSVDAKQKLFEMNLVLIADA